MKVVLIIAIVLQALGIIAKALGIAGLVKTPDTESNSFGVYSTYTILFSVFFEIVFILALVLGV